LRPLCFLIAFEFSETFKVLDLEDLDVTYATVLDLDSFYFLLVFFSTSAAFINFDELILENFYGVYYLDFLGLIGAMVQTDPNACSGTSL